MDSGVDFLVDFLYQFTTNKNQQKIHTDIHTFFFGCVWLPFGRWRCWRRQRSCGSRSTACLLGSVVIVPSIVK